MNSSVDVKKTDRTKMLPNSKKHIDPQCRICRTNYASISFKDEFICESCIDYIKRIL